MFAEQVALQHDSGSLQGSQTSAPVPIYLATVGASPAITDSAMWYIVSALANLSTEIAFLRRRVHAVADAASSGPKHARLPAAAPRSPLHLSQQTTQRGFPSRSSKIMAVEEFYQYPQDPGHCVVEVFEAGTMPPGQCQYSRDVTQFKAFYTRELSRLMASPCSAPSSFPPAAQAAPVPMHVERFLVTSKLEPLSDMGQQEQEYEFLEVQTSVLEKQPSSKAIGEGQSESSNEKLNQAQEASADAIPYVLDDLQTDKDDSVESNVNDLGVFTEVTSNVHYSIATSPGMESLLCCNNNWIVLLKKCPVYNMAYVLFILMNMAVASVFIVDFGSTKIFDPQKLLLW